MSSPIWTPAALSSERRAHAGDCWRMVEAQHRVSTLKLTNSLAEQELLEALLEESKPRVPTEGQGLHYLLAAPFRYGAVYPTGSRFRRAGRTEGVYYGAEHASTAAAEMAFYRLLFYVESPDTPWPANAAEYTVFNAPVKTDRAIDLTKPPLSADRPVWMALVDYAPCQSFADSVRAAELDVIRYESVCDPDHGANLAILSPEAFASKAPAALQTWRLNFGPFGAQALREFPPAALEFGRNGFSTDPRLHAMRWDR